MNEGNLLTMCHGDIGVGQVTTSTAQTEDQTETELSQWPHSATLTPWIIPMGTERPIPWKEPATHISRLIRPTDTVALISFRDPTDWEGIALRMLEAENQSVSIMIIAPDGTDPRVLGTLISNAGDHASMHGRIQHEREKVVFEASDHLMRILGIDLRKAVRNSITLIHQGRVKASWISMSREGSGPHDWSGTQRTLELFAEEEPTDVYEELELEE